MRRTRLGPIYDCCEHKQLNTSKSPECWPQIGHILFCRGGHRQVLPANTVLTMDPVIPSLLGAISKEIEFFADGSSTGGVLHLTQGSASVEVTVRWSDGMVRVHESR